MFFYALFPILFLKINSLKRAGGAFVASFIAASAVHFFIVGRPVIANQETWDTFCFQWLPNQLPVFFLGFITYFLLRPMMEGTRQEAVAELSTSKGLTWVLWITVAMLIPLSMWPSSPISPHFLHAMAFALLIFCVAYRPSKLIVNRFSCYLGKISFSGYLVHFATLANVNKGMVSFGLNHRLAPDWYLVVLAMLSVGATVVIASVTYNLVEVPGQRLGKFLTQKLRQRIGGVAVAT
jgi:peptidoglycan/LPS O-acetylase OafA/YrhL